MLLKSIEYFNFCPFLGKQRIEFSASNEKENVTVILGDNTHGKSTFVLSFIWCFYGVSKFNKPKILNENVENDMRPGEQGKAYVQIEFEDDGKIYTMKRTQRFFMQNNGVLKAEDSIANLTYIENNEQKTVGKMQSDINVAIKSILPYDLSSFFFFEGEKDNEISKKDLSGAVKILIGLEAFDNMRKHLHGPQTQDSPTAASVMGYYWEKQKDASGDAAKKAFAEKVAAEKKIGNVLKRITEINNEIVEYEDKIEEINQVLREAAPSKELQRRRDQIAREIKSAEENERKKNKSFLRCFSEESLALFLTPLLGKTADKLVELDVNDKGIKGIEAKAIRELLHRGECLCGTDLKEGSAAYKSVEKYIEYVPPRSIGVLVSDMQDKIAEYSEKNKQYVSKMEDLYSEILNCRTRIDELEREDKEILIKIREIGEFDTNEAEKNLTIYKGRLRSLREELQRKNSEKGSLGSAIETATNNFNMYKNKNKEVREYQVYYKYAEAIYNWVQDNYEQKEQQVRDKLNKHIKELFDNMYTGHRDISIDEKYNINLTFNGKDVDITGGLRVIKYFSYVGALVKTAYEVMKEREDGDNGEMLGEQYPLVLDAAFSHADSTHTKNIARQLASATSQLIFAVMEKDWNYAKEGLDGHVARIYELQKISETEVKIVEV